MATDSNIKVISILDHPKYKSLFNEGSGKVVHNTQHFQELYMTCALLGHILGVPKKVGIVNATVFALLLILYGTKKIYS